MNPTKTKLFSSVVIFIAGIAIISLHNRIELLSWISVIVGLMFIVPSTLLLINSLIDKEASSSSPSIAITSAAGSICLGLMLCVFPDTFAEFFVYAFAAMLIIVGICHIVSIVKTGLLGGRFYLYIIPVLLIVAGVVIITTDIKRINSAVMLVTGIAFVASSVNSIIGLISLARIKRTSAASDSNDSV